MRVLVVDQDSASNEAIVRSLREHYTVDAVTNKGDCLDLLRSNTFEVVVAAERLEDGSGLELLGQIGKRWPSVLRIFAADRTRLQLLRGRLGPFELFQTLAYPIDPQRLIATLDLATAAQDAHADTSNIQHVVLTAEPPPEPGEPVEETEEAGAEEESEHFPAPRPAARLAPREHVAARRARTPARAEALPRLESSFRSSRSASSPPRRNGGAGSPRPVRRARESSEAASVASGGTARHSGRLPRHARHRDNAGKPPPVRFPPLEAPRDFASTRAGDSELAEAAALARAARSELEPTTGELAPKRLAMMIGGGAVVLLVAVLLGYRLFASKNGAPPAAAPVTAKASPAYPQAVVDLVSQTEAALKSDDFKTVQVDVDKLRQLAPSHPRLAFFEGLLVQRAAAAKPSALQAAGTSKRGHKSSKTSDPAPVQPPASSAAAEAPVPAAAKPAAATPATDAPAPAASTPTTASPAAAMPAPAPGTSAAAAPVAVTPAPAAEAPAAPETPAPAVVATPKPRSSDEPPPVVREAKLLRRVDPEYPSAARRDGVTGSVDLDVTVTDKGVVRAVSVVRGDPPGLFDKSAIAAVRKWKYDPRYVNGLAAEAHLNVHLEFAPNK